MKNYVLGSGNKRYWYFHKRSQKHTRRTKRATTDVRRRRRRRRRGRRKRRRRRSALFFNSKIKLSVSPVLLYVIKLTRYTADRRHDATQQKRLWTSSSSSHGGVLVHFRV